MQEKNLISQRKSFYENASKKRKMDALFKKIIEKTELKNWTLFLFIFAISFTIGLRLITGHWFHIPDAKDKFNQTTLFLLEVFLSSLTITRILVAIKFLEAINRTPIIADFINWVVVERRSVRQTHEGLAMTGEQIGFNIYWWLEYQGGISMREAWQLIHNNIIVKGDDCPDYEICKEAVIGKTIAQCSNENFAIVGLCVFILNPALYRHLDKAEYGGFLDTTTPTLLGAYYFDIISCWRD